jgi:multiple antibiotic resistance protein
VEPFLLAFIPLFVAIDVFGVLPLFVSLTQHLDATAQRRLAGEAALTALAVSVLFVAAGAAVFRFLGIAEYDFRVGGGIVLLILAVRDVLGTLETERSPDGDVGIVPIGVPLIMGPAALTTTLILLDSYGWTWTVASLCTNRAIVWLVFREARLVTRVLGRAGGRAVAKVVALLLAGIGVMMIRTGVTAMLRDAS